MQTIRFDFNPMMAEYVGEHGIARAEMETLLTPCATRTPWSRLAAARACRAG